MRYFDLVKKNYERRRHYWENRHHYFRIIGEFFHQHLSPVEVYLFGSALTDRFSLPHSDIDILAISPKAPTSSREKAELLAELDQHLGWPNPFEIHIITPELYRSWYQRLIPAKKRLWPPANRACNQEVPGRDGK